MAEMGRNQKFVVLNFTSKYQLTLGTGVTFRTVALQTTVRINDLFIESRMMMGAIATFRTVGLQTPKPSFMSTR
jgi:hypothetical protein